VVILPEAAKCGKVKFAELREIAQVLHRISTAASIFTLVTRCPDPASRCRNCRARLNLTLHERNRLIETMRNTVEGLQSLEREAGRLERRPGATKAITRLRVSLCA
jgi:hypothetical protein